MDHTIARKLLRDELGNLRAHSYSFFVHSVNQTTHKETVGPDGKRYQIEVEIFWDSRPSGNIRVMGCVDDGNLRSLKPLTESFIITPAGTFLGE
jgi:hypothetical protein